MMPRLIVVLAALLLTGCASTLKGERYKDVGPRFDLVQFFDGDIKAWGIVQDRSGNVVQRFKAQLNGRIQGDTLVLDEEFSYGLGNGIKERTWRIRETENGQYVGEAADVPGGATGTNFGNATRFMYAFDLPVGDKTYKVTFDDWLWAFDDTTVVNRSYVRKFGVTVAEVTIFMQRQ